jgi:cellulose synthase/poly-beta-1,6-N-acetylglucosamine synthase-like glycosyltransferase
VTLLAAVVVLALAVMFAIQAAIVLYFTMALLRSRVRLVEDDACPNVALILCLRGGDPFLADTLNAVFDLDYPRFDLRVVVDSRSDPAWAVVEQVVRQRGAKNVTIEPLEQRLDSCSLKCSSVVQTASRLDQSYEVLALLDADTIPHRTWLRELVAPLADETVGGATGNRWYMPHPVTWAGLVRCFWNMAAVPQMYLYNIAWGGTLALKTEVLRRGDLLDRWAHAFCEDTMLFRMLRRHGLKVAFVPSLMMVNRESCELGGFFRWVRRQLLTARLYHPGWSAVLLHGVSTSLGLIAAIVIGLAALALGDWQAALISFAGLAAYELCLLPFVLLMEWSVRRIARRRGEPTGWLGIGGALRLLPGMVFTQIVYAFALTSSLLIREVDWRGVHYRIDGPFAIRLLEYRPYQAESATDSNASL